MNCLYILLAVMVLLVGPFAGVAVAKVITGTGGDDTLVGTDRDDRIEGRGGDDAITSDEGDDRVYAGHGDDFVDTGEGDDKVYGGAGNDVITPGEGHDKVYAGGGNDRIYARDGDLQVDYVDCGAGFDRVETIHRDDRTLSNCERAPGPRRSGG
jgi:hypothetical protein